MFIPAGLRFNLHPDRIVSIENAVNMQPETVQGGRSQVILRSCPGLSQFSAGNPGGSEGRGAVAANGAVYAVLGTRLYRVSSTGIATDVGRVDGTGPVSMAASSDEIVIANGIDNYRHVFSTGTTSSISGDPGGYTTAFLNGRFVMENPDATGASAGRIFWSNLNDGSTWNALDYANAEQKPDRTVRVMAFGANLIVFGVESIEYWRGNADGFVPVTGMVSSVGLANRYAAAQSQDYVCFLASDGTVRLLDGARPVRVSNTAVEAILTASSGAKCSSYVDEGRTIFEFSTTTRTLCYDVTEQAWFEKQTSESRHKASAYVYGFGKTLALANDDGKVYELTRDAYPDRREFTTATIADDANRQWNVIDELELICNAGTVNTDPAQVVLRASRDNQTFGEERWASLGVKGQYETRARWRRLGRFRSLSLKFRMTDQSDWTVLGVHARGR